MKKVTLSLIVLLTAIILWGCSSNYSTVPPNFIGKILTPQGWSDGIIESGQVDIGQTNANGLENTLVLVENSTVTVKESFSKTNEEDHRISTMNPEKSPPLSVDVRVQIGLPTEKNQREAIFSMVSPQGRREGTPGSDRNSERTSYIYLDSIYYKLEQYSPDITTIMISWQTIPS